MTLIVSAGSFVLPSPNTGPRVAIMSLWRNDVDRQITVRMERLIDKTYRNRRYIWVYGDCDDSTGEILTAAAAEMGRIAGIDIEVVRHDTGISGNTTRCVDISRLLRLSLTANAGFRRLRHDDDYLLIHESDLVTPPDLIERFLTNAANGCCPISGWPTLCVNGNTLFYDTWAYSDMSGRYFSNLEPHPTAVFALRSFGSVAMIHGEDARAITLESEAFREICGKIRANGRTLWCDPSISVVQPTELW